MKINKTMIAACVGVLAFAGVAISQTTSVRKATVVNPTDLFQIIPLGQGRAASTYVNPAQITSQSGYQKYGTGDVRYIYLRQLAELHRPQSGDNGLLPYYRACGSTLRRRPPMHLFDASDFYLGHTCQYRAVDQQRRDFLGCKRQRLLSVFGLQSDLGPRLSADQCNGSPSIKPGYGPSQ